MPPTSLIVSHSGSRQGVESCISCSQPISCGVNTNHTTSSTRSLFQLLHSNHRGPPPSPLTSEHRTQMGTVVMDSVSLFTATSTLGSDASTYKCLSAWRWYLCTDTHTVVLLWPTSKYSLLLFNTIRAIDALKQKKIAFLEYSKCQLLSACSYTKLCANEYALNINIWFLFKCLTNEGIEHE